MQRGVVRSGPKGDRDGAEDRGPPPRAGTKLACFVEMLRRPEGASIGEIVEALDWQAHTVRGAVAGALKKKVGLTVATTKVEGCGTVYRISAELRRRTELANRRTDTLVGAWAPTFSPSSTNAAIRIWLRRSQVSFSTVAMQTIFRICELRDDQRVHSIWCPRSCRYPADHELWRHRAGRIAW